MEFFTGLILLEFAPSADVAPAVSGSFVHGRI